MRSKWNNSLIWPSIIVAETYKTQEVKNEHMIPFRSEKCGFSLLGFKGHV